MENLENSEEVRIEDANEGETGQQQLNTQVVSGNTESQEGLKQTYISTEINPGEISKFINPGSSYVLLTPTNAPTLSVVSSNNDPISSEVEEVNTSVKKINSTYRKTSEVARLIPEFDGKSISIQEFIKDCKEAEVFVNAADKSFFFKLIKSKLTGDAKIKFRFKEPKNLDDLYIDLNRVFSSPQNLAQIQVEIARAVQEKDERVNDYGWRVTRLLHKAVENIRENFSGEVANGMLEGTREVALKCFLMGLKSDVAISMESKTARDLEEAITKAAECEKDLRQRRELRGEISELSDIKKRLKCYNIDVKSEEQGKEGPRCYRCAEVGHFARECPQDRTVGTKPREGRTCFYCGGAGHIARDCRAETRKRRAPEDEETGARYGKRRKSCNYCQRSGHEYIDCYQRLDDENSRKVRDNGLKVCTYCKRRGHEYHECRTRSRDIENSKRAVKAEVRKEEESGSKTKPLNSN